MANTKRPSREETVRSHLRHLTKQMNGKNISPQEREGLNKMADKLDKELEAIRQIKRAKAKGIPKR